jgi:hypothetical protein
MRKRHHHPALLEKGPASFRSHCLHAGGTDCEPDRRLHHVDRVHRAAIRRTGLSIAGTPDGPEPQDFATTAAAASPLRKLLLAIQSATADFLDVAFYFVIGVAITSVFSAGVNREALAPIAESPVTSILVLMIVAALLALCSTTDAFVAAVQFSQFSPAANLAFLLFGPVFDLKLFWLYGLIFKRKFVVMLAIGLFILIAILSMLWGSMDLMKKRGTDAGTMICNPAVRVV